MSETRRGAIYGVAAYLLWGVFPLYFPLLDPSGPVEVLAHRVAWSLAVMALVVVAVRKGPAVRAVVADRRRFAQLSVAAVLLCINWGTYIYGVTSEHVVETSLGYFINPLVTVLLGVFVLREQLRPVQWAALGVASVAVLVLSVENGRPPWISLVLAFSFGTYGLLKKTARVGAVEGLAVETAVLAPLAVAYIALLAARGDSTFRTEGAGHATLLILTGVITAVPLLFFGAAASRVPLSTLGPLQYIAPTVQFLIGVLVFDEHLGSVKLLGFVLVWMALGMFTADVVGEARRVRVRVPVAEPV